MSKEKQAQLVAKVVYFMALGYFVYLIYGAVTSNYRTTQKISSLKAEIDLLNSEKAYIADLNDYYVTNTYKELEARRKLGMKKPDEKVIRIPIDPARLSQIEKRETVSQPIQAPGANEPMGNPEKWLRFILKI